MNRLLFILILSLSLQGLSYESYPSRDPYTIISDSVDTSLQPGTCLVFGTAVVQPNYPIQNGTVATMNRSSSAFTDSKGNYSLMLNENDSAIFFYHPEYGEIVIWKYDFKSQHRVHINFYARSKYEEHQMVKKPVIYLYSDSEMNVELTLTHPKMTFTYPVYEDGWKVKTLADGSIQNRADQKNYPYLFWEGESTSLRYLSENNVVKGQLIKTDEIVTYLESALTAMGLNRKEQTDFITFWAPAIIKSPYVFIQFLVDEEYDNQIAELTVTPKPESRRRIFMQYTLLESAFVPFEFVLQEFSTFERTGLTLVEWGGSEISFRLEAN